MGCTVDTITLSVQQKAMAEERIQEAGLQDKITVHLMDYRSMPPKFEKVFDACISIEMLEVSVLLIRQALLMKMVSQAVGSENMAKYVSVIDWALKTERAAAVLSASTYPEGTYSAYQCVLYPSSAV